jgi:lipid-A-disaccharide synthase
MLVAAEPSGDLLASELVRAWRGSGVSTPAFFGAGGEAMQAAGVDLAFDLTRHAIIGIPSPADYFKFRRLRDQLVDLALSRKPRLFIGVDAFAFNGSLAAKLRAVMGSACPRLAHYVSPQVWASRPGRAKRLEAYHDLLACILPFEPDWYRTRAPRLKVEFVGHPLVDRCGPSPSASEPGASSPKELLLLPGSRPGELQRHIPVMLPAAMEIGRRLGIDLRMILPNDGLAGLARSVAGDKGGVAIQTGGLRSALAGPVIAIASTGTVTLECAWHGVPTVAIYKASPLTYLIGRRIVTVRHLAMPNLLAGGLEDPPPPGFQPVMPELIQNAATPRAIIDAVMALAGDREAYLLARRRLLDVVRRLGPPGASTRAAAAFAGLLTKPPTAPP